MAQRRPKDEPMDQPGPQTSFPNTQSFSSYYWCCCCEIDLSNEDDFLTHLESIEHLQGLMCCHLLSQKTYRLIYLLFQNDNHRCNLCRSDFADAGDFIMHMSMCGVPEGCDKITSSDSYRNSENAIQSVYISSEQSVNTTVNSEAKKVQRGKNVDKNSSGTSRKRKYETDFMVSESSICDTKTVETVLSAESLPQLDISNSRKSKHHSVRPILSEISTGNSSSIESSTPNSEMSYCAICDVNVDTARMPSHLTSKSHFRNCKNVEVKREASDDSDECVMTSSSKRFLVYGTTASAYQEKLSEVWGTSEQPTDTSEMSLSTGDSELGEEDPENDFDELGQPLGKNKTSCKICSQTLSRFEVFYHVDMVHRRNQSINLNPVEKKNLVQKYFRGTDSCVKCSKRIHVEKKLFHIMKEHDTSKESCAIERSDFERIHRAKNLIAKFFDGKGNTKMRCGVCMKKVADRLLHIYFVHYLQKECPLIRKRKRKLLGEYFDGSACRGCSEKQYEELKVCHLYLKHEVELEN